MNYPMQLSMFDYSKSYFLSVQALRDPEMLSDAASLFGSQSIVGSIDAKLVDGEYKCAICDGQEIVDISPLELVKKAEALGCGEIIINSVDNDGMMKGCVLDLV